MSSGYCAKHNNHYGASCVSCPQCFDNRMSERFNRPWAEGALREWSICGMNHYNLKGQKMLFVSMVKNGKCIRVEGKDDYNLWGRLRKKAYLA